jgi:hypothetical protein
MAKYVANPVIVDAYKIVRIMPDSDPSTGLALMLEGGECVVADPGMTARMAPVVGDYWVIQADGYIYLNPKSVFERKYHRIEEAVNASQ